MKEKIMNVKNILRIIISLLVIFSMTKSCAKALTYEDIKTYVNQTADYYSLNSNYQQIKQKVNSVSTSDINNINNMANGYNNVCIYKLDNTHFNIRVFNATTLTSDYQGIYYTGTYKTIQWSGSWGSIYGPYNTANSSIDGGYCYKSTTGQENSLWGMALLGQTPTGQLPNTFVGNQGLVPLVNIYFGNMFSTTVSYNGEEMQANTLDYNYRIEFIDNVVTEDNEITSMVATLDGKPLEVQDMGSYWTLKENNSTTLKYNQIYTLNVQAIVNSKEEEIEEKVIFVPPGTTISGGVITSIPSGDYNFNTENATNQIIENQNQNNTFWQETYNSLFVMNSGDVDRLITNMKENIKIDNFGDVSGEIAILNTLTGEPSDFIIAWNPTQYMGKTIIPSGEINFSQKVREVPALKTTQDWLRIIMGYSITIVLMSEIFFTILRCLGVGVSIYEQHNEEIARLEEMHTPKIYDTEVMTPRGIKRYRTRRTRIQ